MSPEHASILCLTFAGLGLSYIWWSSARVTMFQADLQKDRSELDATMRALGMTGDPNYLRLRGEITDLIAYAPDLSLKRTIKEHPEIRPWPKEEVDARITQFFQLHDAPKEIVHAKIVLIIRLALFFLAYPPDLLMAFYWLARGKYNRIAATLTMVIQADEASVRRGTS